MKETELRLLAPDLTNDVRAARETARIVHDTSQSASQAEIAALEKDFLKHTMSVVTKMRSLLGTEQSNSKELSPAEQTMIKGMV